MSCKQPKVQERAVAIFALATSVGTTRFRQLIDGGGGGFKNERAAAAVALISCCSCRPLAAAREPLAFFFFASDQRSSAARRELVKRQKLGQLLGFTTDSNLSTARDLIARFASGLADGQHVYGSSSLRGQQQQVRHSSHNLSRILNANILYARNML